MDDLQQLGAGTATKYPQHPDDAVLETFPAPPGGFVNKVTFICEDEFTSLCEITKQPDFGSIQIDYKPREKVLESKSLKLLLFSYRNVNMFYERIVHDILARLVEAVDPIWMTVTATMRPRGGIALTAEASWGNGTKVRPRPLAKKA